jgi:deoxyribodipyrimidine photo-lyase
MQNHPALTRGLRQRRARRAAGTGNDTKLERFDPDGVYVRRYIPELKSVEGKAVHRPWWLDLDLDYPRPLESYRDEAIWLRD